MKTYTQEEVVQLLKKSIQLAREESFVPYTDGEMSHDHTEGSIIKILVGEESKPEVSYRNHRPERKGFIDWSKPDAQETAYSKITG